MNIIKRVIDAERWEAGDHGLAPMPSVEHNAALDRIKEAVMTYVTEIEQALGTLRKTVLEKRIDELEAQLPKKPKPTGVVHREYHAAVVERLEQRIAELEFNLGRYEAAMLEINHVRVSNFPDRAGQKLSEALKEGITELKAQLPKVVTPVNGKCPNCGGWCGWNYCKHCGSKLNWSVS